MRATLVEHLLARACSERPASEARVGSRSRAGSASAARGSVARASGSARAARWRASSRVLARGSVRTKLGGQLAQAARGSRAARRRPRVRAASDPRTPSRSIRRAEEHVRRAACRARRSRAVQLDEALDPFARLRRDLRRLGGGAEPERPDRACACARPGSRARGRPGAARSAGGQSARTTAAASCGSTSRRIHASTSRTSARLRNAAPRPPRGSSSGADRRWRDGDPRARARSKDTRAAAPRARLRSRVDVDRLGRSPADRRADRRLAALRAACAPRRSSRCAHDFAAPRERLQRPRARRPSCRRWRSVDRPGVDRGEPADDAPAARAADRARGRAAGVLGGAAAARPPG